MNFKQATDALLESITLEDMARELEVSIQALRQARASEGSTAYRTPPSGWERAAIKVINRRVRELSALAKALKSRGNC